MSISDLPALNATLNFSSAVLVALGFYFIKNKNIRAHKTCMISAVVVSSLFLTSYLIYHYLVGTVRFTRPGWIRDVYFPILISHTILAVVILPLVVRTLDLALKKRFGQHANIARWTFPTWMYVSITGVAVYVMLYRF